MFFTDLNCAFFVLISLKTFHRININENPLNHVTGFACRILGTLPVGTPCLGVYSSQKLFAGFLRFRTAVSIILLALCFIRFFPTLLFAMKTS